VCNSDLVDVRSGPGSMSNGGGGLFHSHTLGKLISSTFDFRVGVQSSPPSVVIFNFSFNFQASDSDLGFNYFLFDFFNYV